jgi:hypothetical protein
MKLLKVWTCRESAEGKYSEVSAMSVICLYLCTVPLTLILCVWRSELCLAAKNGVFGSALILFFSRLCSC